MALEVATERVIYIGIPDILGVIYVDRYAAFLTVIRGLRKISTNVHTEIAILRINDNKKK